MVSHEISAVFRAIADPTRREILDLLRGQSLNVREISARFPVSRPAISKHLRILKESNLVRERRQGRERLYSAHLEPLAHVRAWVGTDAGSASRLHRTPGIALRGARRTVAPVLTSGGGWRVW